MATNKYPLWQTLPASIWPANRRLPYDTMSWQNFRMSRQQLLYTTHLASQEQGKVRDWPHLSLQLFTPERRACFWRSTKPGCSKYRNKAIILYRSPVIIGWRNKVNLCVQNVKCVYLLVILRLAPHFTQLTVSHPCEIKHKTLFSKLSWMHFLIEDTSTVILNYFFK